VGRCKTELNKIAIFISNYTIGNNPSIVNLLEFLSDKYWVDLYLRSVSLKNVNVLRKKNINIIELKRKSFFRHLRLKQKARTGYYKSYICIDPHGFVLCKDLFPESRPIYYSLELYMKKDHFGLSYSRDVMEKERKEIGRIKGLIIQSKEKESLFRKDYNLTDLIPSLIIPVTYNGASVKKKSQLIRDRFNIHENKKIALHLGGIASWFSCIELAVSFSKLSAWVLFFQGYPDTEYLSRLKTVIAQNNILNVIISEELYDSIDDVDSVVMACDLGVAWYNDISIGFRTAGKSSGKIAAYLKFGLPVVAKKYPSTYDAIENTVCGVCIDDFDEIRNAVYKIEERYSEYSQNARTEYDKTYRFENYKNKLLDFIE